MSTMPWAYNLTSFHFGLSQRLAVVCATVFYRVNVRAAAYDNDRDAVDLGEKGAVSLTDSLSLTSIHSEVIAAYKFRTYRSEGGPLQTSSSGSTADRT